MNAKNPPPAVASPGSPATVQRQDDRLVASGAWILEGIRGLERRLPRPPSSGQWVLDASHIATLDTTGALSLLRSVDTLSREGATIRLEGLRDTHRPLVELVRSRQAAAGQVEAPPPQEGPLARLGRVAWDHVQQGLGFTAFVGEAFTALLRALLDPRRIRWKALFANIETAGVNALPIIALLTFLMGMVIAYQGGEQLKLYGANIFIVELVTLTMLRELAPLLTAIIVAGRTGSAFTAQIGTMQVTEEVDALRTIGIQPMDLLVLPKMLALMVVLPLLSVFADIASVFGGMVMAFFLLDISFGEFLRRVPEVVSLVSFMLGVGKAPVFAIIIALVGCYQGFQVRGGADAVGRQTTISVVQAIFLVILADAFFAVMFGGLGI